MRKPLFFDNRIQSAIAKPGKNSYGPCIAAEVGNERAGLGKRVAVAKDCPLEAFLEAIIRLIYVIYGGNQGIADFVIVTGAKNKSFFYKAVVHGEILKGDAVEAV